MSISRRSILRNFGLLTARQSLVSLSLPLVSLLAGCRKARTTTVIFEGPWLFTPASDPDNPSGPELLLATSIGDSSKFANHQCGAGNPNGKDLRYPQNASTGLSLGCGQTWIFDLSGSQYHGSFSTVSNAFRNGFYIPNLDKDCVSPQSPVRQVLLPLPHTVKLAAKQEGVSITHTSDSSIPAMSPFIATILEYVGDDPILTPRDGSLNFQMDSKSHFIFRMSFTDKAIAKHGEGIMADQDTWRSHFEDVFAQMMSLIKWPTSIASAPLKIEVTNEHWKSDGFVTQYGTDELGLDPKTNDSTETSRIVGPADCAMGGGAGGWRG